MTIYRERARHTLPGDAATPRPAQSRRVGFDPPIREAISVSRDSREADVLAHVPPRTLGIEHQTLRLTVNHRHIRAPGLYEPVQTPNVPVIAAIQPTDLLPDALTVISMAFRVKCSKVDRIQDYFSGRLCFQIRPTAPATMQAAMSVPTLNSPLCVFWTAAFPRTVHALLIERDSRKIHYQGQILGIKLTGGKASIRHAQVSPDLRA